MALRSILTKRLASYQSKKWSQPLLQTRCAVFKCDISTHQSNVWISYFSLQQNRNGCYQLTIPKTSITHESVRYYAKSRDKKKSDKGHKKKVHINEELLAEVINANAMQEQMQGAVEKLKQDFVKNLSLRSSSGSIEVLPITFEGKDYILQDLAQVVRKNPKTVVINMAAFPQAIPTVVQAIGKSGMNLNPQQDGTSLFIPIPKVTKEHRESLSKNAKALFIKCRDSVKDVQNKYIKTVKSKEKDGLSQDVANQISDYIGQVGSEYISTAEKILEAKQHELLNEA